MLVVGSWVFPYYPYIPGPLLPEGSELVAITSDPDEAARAPMGDAIVADVRLTLEALVERGRRVRPRAGRAAAASPTAGRASDPIEPGRRRARARRGVPRRTGSSCSSRPPATLALRNQLRLSQPGSYYFGAGGGLGFGLAAAVGVQLAQPDRPVVCVIGEGSAQYAITAFWTAAAYEVPVTFLVLRNERVRDPEVVRGARAGHGRARARPAGAGDGRDRTAYGVDVAHGSTAREELREALGAAIGSGRRRSSRSRSTPGMALF